MFDTDDLKTRSRSREMSEKSLGIEEQSMRIIDSEVGTHKYNYLEWSIVRRVIHATADFDFAKSNGIIFSLNAIESAFRAFQKKQNIVTDVEMVLSGINKRSLGRIGIKALCNLSNEQVIGQAKTSEKTRSALAMRYSLPAISDGIVAIGNAPTALYEIISMIREDLVMPALIIGIPVGFVSAVESKAELENTKCEYITNLGRKGGTPAVSSIVNALMLLYIDEFLK
ncbi:MAG TPA: precorrin-8X methylmutase [Nitrososphaeraceae archaeon]|nr:precorrin-8X methylmutase [Nitrososphaeraceae archaeon]